MPIRSRTNLYRGVNAHLHSHLQHEPGGWKVFHSKHISDIAEALDQQLPPGYEVGLTKSLQIAAYHPDTGKKIESMERDDEAYLTAVEVRWVENEDEPGIPVTRIELLSPTNKPPGDGYLQYREKRNLNIEEGTPLIEIDYLHKTRSPIRKVPSYPGQQPESHPYLIAITDPRPNPADGRTNVYGFDVDEPIPILDIPLKNDAVLRFDFGAVYSRTFASLSYFSNRVDYETEPDAFETYTQADQKRIRERMKSAGSR